MNLQNDLLKEQVKNEQPGDRSSGTKRVKKIDGNTFASATFSTKNASPGPAARKGSMTNSPGGMKRKP